MIRQYNPQRFYNENGKRVGTIRVADIFYIQDRIKPFSFPKSCDIKCINPWIVEAWIPRECLGARLAGGHLAQVRSLRDGRVKLVADWILLACKEAGLEKCVDQGKGQFSAIPKAAEYRSALAV